MNSKKNLAILVISTDKYSDIWDVYFEYFKKYWPDCPFKIYFLTNYKKPHFKNWKNKIKIINIGKEVSWSDNLLNALNYINERYILMTLDDLIFMEKVNTKKLKEIYFQFIKDNGEYLHLVPSPAPTKKWNKYYGLLEQQIPYRVSTVCSIWNKEVLKDLLVKGESAWEFEIFGSLRSNKYEKFYATYQNIIKVKNVIVKGKVFESFLMNNQHIIKKNSLLLERKRISKYSEWFLNIKTKVDLAIINYSPLFIKKLITRYLLLKFKDRKF